MSERLADGTEFGPYTIEGLIAGGGMGQVYAARHSVFGNTVALKVLHPNLHADPGWRARFNEEGLVGTQLKHPHVLSARELVHNEGRIALVVDLVPGGQTLERVMSREFRDGLPLVPALNVFLKILQGMDYLHGKGIVHGDLKPENVMIEGDFRKPETWVPKVADFGTVALIANPVEIDGRAAVVATPRYASPEHLYGVDQIETRSDVYCLGLLLHFLLTGRHASNAQTVREAAERVALPVPIVTLVDQPDALIQTFKKATSLEPEDRFASARELALAIRTVLDAVGATLDLPDVAADLATEVDEERAAQRRASAPPASEKKGSSDSQAETVLDAERVPAPPPPQRPAPEPVDTDEPEPAPAPKPTQRRISTDPTPAPSAAVPVYVWAAGAVAVLILVVVAWYAWAG
ncbi:MAG: serine/threonine protein kinase [Alphaproteobacteria bacterium]|nr:serine/threonine protein kinase [Alphaproteobacteria bacterium]MCB9696404.1 serine/threonine protein kinase [Alphaproteobacteria bacterium]